MAAGRKWDEPMMRLVLLLTSVTFLFAAAGSATVKGVIGASCHQMHRLFDDGAPTAMRMMPC